MATIRLYACAITLALWSLMWTLDVRGDMFVGFMLAMTTVALVIAERERSRRRQEDRR